VFGGGGLDEAVLRMRIEGNTGTRESATDERERDRCFEGLTLSSEMPTAFPSCNRSLALAPKISNTDSEISKTSSDGREDEGK